MHKVIAGVSFLLLWCGGPTSGMSSELDQTVANFLSACAERSSVWSKCSFAVTTIGIFDEYNMLGTHSTCPPRSSSEPATELETKSVINWLSPRDAQPGQI
jgi:hypothetical protein